MAHDGRYTTKRINKLCFWCQFSPKWLSDAKIRGTYLFYLRHWRVNFALFFGLLSWEVHVQLLGWGIQDFLKTYSDNVLRSTCIQISRPQNQTAEATPTLHGRDGSFLIVGPVDCSPNITFLVVNIKFNFCLITPNYFKIFWGFRWCCLALLQAGCFVVWAQIWLLFFLANSTMPPIFV